MPRNDDRRSYDTAASGDVQGNLQGVIAQLERVLTDRDRAVKAAMADFTADGVADDYHGKETRWHSAASEVREIIRLVHRTLGQNDGTAHSTLAKARAAVDNIG
ncbi:pore-forming ESAT-6 family protein [Streptomyces sp. NPDC058045]|uniref:pore-forming ESAT-6 family protein n=1 Tax=Streptomyces sp. NPDC058045 TaxID=3346311 RepID=UPI0036E81716